MFSIVSMNNGQNGSSSILSIIQPVNIDTMLNNNGPFFKKKVTCKHGFRVHGISEKSAYFAGDAHLYVGRKFWNDHL